MKLLCSQCYQELESVIYEDLGTYINPCTCTLEREAEVSEAAAKYILNSADLYFANLVEDALDFVNLDGEDEISDLEVLNLLLISIINCETKLHKEVETDIYEDLDV